MTKGSGKKDQSDINDIIKKILRQQSHLKAHLNRLEKMTPTTETETVTETNEKHKKGSGYPCAQVCNVKGTINRPWIYALF